MYFLITILTVFIFIDATLKEKSILIGFLSIVSSYVQLIGYGSGFIISYWKNVIQGKRYEKAFTKKFYN